MALTVKLLLRWRFTATLAVRGHLTCCQALLLTVWP